MSKLPLARTLDRTTSHEAAESVTEYTLTETKKNILKLLETSMTDEWLVDIYQRNTLTEGWAYASASGIRSRRNELVIAGLVESVGFAVTRAGRRTTVWQVARA